MIFLIILLFKLHNSVTNIFISHDKISIIDIIDKSHYTITKLYQHQNTKSVSSDLSFQIKMRYLYLKNESSRRQKKSTRIQCWKIKLLSPAMAWILSYRYVAKLRQVIYVCFMLVVLFIVTSYFMLSFIVCQPPLVVWTSLRCNFADSVIRLTESQYWESSHIKNSIYLPCR